MKITWFGHSAFRLDFADKVVLIDPFLTGNPSFGGDVAAATAGVPRTCSSPMATATMSATRVAIAKATGAMVVTNYDLLMWLASQGVQNWSR